MKLRAELLKDLQAILDVSAPGWASWPVLLKVMDRYAVMRAYDIGDVVYVRHGSHAVRVAVITEIGAGKDEGLYVVRPWSESSERFMSHRKISPLDLRGFPDERQAEKIRKEMARAVS